MNNKIKVIRKKKGQEESMGFVVIVLILVVVGVVFLGFSLRKTTSSVQNQQELADLTWSVLSYTSNCSILGERQSIWDLSKKCARGNQVCENGMHYCSNLNATIQDIFKRLKGTDVTLQNKSIHAYEFVIEMPGNKAIARQGNMSYGDYVSYLTFIPTNINVSARFYYS